MKPLRTVAIYGPASPTPNDLLQAQRMIVYHLLHGNWRIVVHSDDALRSMVEKWCKGRLFEVYRSRRLMAMGADRIIAIGRPDIARVMTVRGREAWLLNAGWQIIPMPLFSGDEQARAA